MVQIAGQAKTKLTRLKLNEAISAMYAEVPACSKMVDE